MLLNSSDITHEAEIPARYTCKGENLTPSFKLAYVPMNAKSLVFIVEDPDAELGLWTHLMMWDISADLTEIEEGKLPEGVIGRNTNGAHEWDSICPPEDKEHRIYFKIYAVDVEKLELDPDSATREQLLEAMEGHIVAHAEIIGKGGKITPIEAV